MRELEKEKARGPGFVVALSRAGSSGANPAANAAAASSKQQQFETWCPTPAALPCAGGAPAAEPRGGAGGAPRPRRLLLRRGGAAVRRAPARLARPHRHAAVAPGHRCGGTAQPPRRCLHDTEACARHQAPISACGAGMSEEERPQGIWETFHFESPREVAQMLYAQAAIEEAQPFALALEAGGAELCFGCSCRAKQRCTAGSRQPCTGPSSSMPLVRPRRLQAPPARWAAPAWCCASAQPPMMTWAPAPPRSARGCWLGERRGGLGCLGCRHSGGAAAAAPRPAIMQQPSVFPCHRLKLQASPTSSSWPARARRPASTLRFCSSRPRRRRRPPPAPPCHACGHTLRPWRCRRRSSPAPLGCPHLARWRSRRRPRRATSTSCRWGTGDGWPDLLCPACLPAPATLRLWVTRGSALLLLLPACSWTPPATRAWARPAWCARPPAACPPARAAPSAPRPPGRLTPMGRQVALDSACWRAAGMAQAGAAMARLWRS